MNLHVLLVFGYLGLMWKRHYTCASHCNLQDVLLCIFFAEEKKEVGLRNGILQSKKQPCNADIEVEQECREGLLTQNLPIQELGDNKQQHRLQKGKEDVELNIMLLMDESDDDVVDWNEGQCSKKSTHVSLERNSNMDLLCTSKVCGGLHCGKFF